MSKLYLVLGEVVFVVAVCIFAVVMFRQHPPLKDAVHADIRLADTHAQVYMQKDQAGAIQYFIWHPGGALDRVSMAELTNLMYDASKGGGIASFLGAGSGAVLMWLGIGFLGQMLFTGRMVVQWIASERKGTSVVPPMFWWMSLVGSLLLLSYFLWRRDPIGLLGQAFGSFVYLRNIIWILEGKKLDPVPVTQAEDPMPET
jgi:lipid-A-disaccharide synthase-like uncharacterized protein